jgi:membrane protein
MKQQWQFLLAALAITLAHGTSRSRVSEQPHAIGSARPDSRRGRASGEGKPLGKRNENAGDAPAYEILQPGRGRLADSPSEIPKRGWRDVLLRVKQQIGEDNISLTAAGVAYGWLLAIFPLLGSLIAIYGLIADPAAVQQQVEGLFGLLSPEVVSALHDQLTKLTQKSEAALGFGALFGILFSLWSANSGTKAMISALNIVYSEHEKRSFVRLNRVSLTLTIGTILATVAALLLMVVLPLAFRFAGMEESAKATLTALRWPVLAIGFMIALAVLFRYAPSREKPRWRWVSWGSVVATILWIIASGAFAIYVSNFGKYDETYGSLGAVIILLMWFYITAFIILLGAELNAELEHQTAKDSTTKAPKPMGLRGAHMADTLGARP